MPRGIKKSAAKKPASTVATEKPSSYYGYCYDSQGTLVSSRELSEEEVLAMGNVSHIIVGNRKYKVKETRKIDIIALGSSYDFAFLVYLTDEFEEQPYIPVF